jgi:uncharacterized protein (DUF2236 family)
MSTTRNPPIDRDPPDADAERGPRSAPLGPESLTWRHLADVRGVLLTQRSAVLQVMHPDIAVALSEHSDVFENPLQRLIRSAGPILGVVYDEDAGETARWVRDQHVSIRGRRPDGERYHALDPATYYWAHATFFESQIATQELFGTPFTMRQKEQLYEESISWYERYGLSMRPVPRDYYAFMRYWEEMLEDTLEATSLALAAVRTDEHLPSPWPAIEGAAWSAVRPVFANLGPWLARGTLPSRARETLGIGWSRGDVALMQTLRVATRAAWPVMPSQLRMLPRATRRHVSVGPGG